MTSDIVVIGAGPGGYTAAFYAADHGKKVILVDQDKRLGGVCLNRGCIPSKALLHATALLREADASGMIRGITFGTPKVELEKLRTWKESMLERLAHGVRTLARHRGVEVMVGQGRFVDSHTVRVDTADGEQRLTYETAIVAVGSIPAMPKAFALDDPRIMTSTEALELQEIPQDLLIVGGGYIGMELGTVYATLGSRVVLVEAMDSILSGVDADLVRPVMRYAQKAFRDVRLKTTVTKMATSGASITVTCESQGAQHDERYDRVLVCVGRLPNCGGLGLERTNVRQDARGFITVNAQQQTTDPAIYAIGDVAGGPLLAHKASKEARIAVDAITGQAGTREGVVIPAVVFTDPEVAWCGLSEAEAKANHLDVRISRFPWSASGRAVTLDRPDGLTKLVIDPKTERILGVGIVGVGAGELISEGVVAMELGASAKQLARAVHPHPTLSETLMECAESFYGSSTHTMTRAVRC